MHILNRSCLCTIVAAIPVLTSAFAADGQRPANSRTEVQVVADEADAVLAILAARRANAGLPEGAWSRLFASEGYRGLKARELGMRRPFTDSAFRTFVLSDTLLSRYESLKDAMASYRTINIRRDADRALAYLPEGASITARLYLEIKPRTNSFVFDLPEGRAIFLYVDPGVPPETVERDIVTHEMHHIGFSLSCPASATLPAPRNLARDYSGALGEGFAMLAAAGNPDVDPHESSPLPERERWHRDVARWREDFQAVQAFLLDVAEARIVNADSIATRAAPFWGDAQGAWYTVGYMMAVTIEHARGRDALHQMICDRSVLMSAYNEVARKESLPVWDDQLIALLRK